LKEVKIDKNLALHLTSDLTSLEMRVETLECYGQSMALLTLLVALLPKVQDVSNPLQREIKLRASPPQNLATLSDSAIQFVTRTLPTKLGSNASGHYTQLRNTFIRLSDLNKLERPNANTYSFDLLLIAVLSQPMSIVSKVIQLHLDKERQYSGSTWQQLVSATSGYTQRAPLLTIAGSEVPTPVNAAAINAVVGEKKAAKRKNGAATTASSDTESDTEGGEIRGLVGIPKDPGTDDCEVLEDEPMPVAPKLAVVLPKKQKRSYTKRLTSAAAVTNNEDIFSGGGGLTASPSQRY
jgi:hypothetical protein